MIETAWVFDKFGRTIHWHEPLGRSGGSIPDTRDLWTILWENRDLLGGVAHTHPWKGEAWPSQTDVTTFRACEQGLGKLLLWPVVTFTDTCYLLWHEAEYVRITSGKVVQIRGERFVRSLECGFEVLRERSHSDIDPA